MITTMKTYLYLEQDVPGPIEITEQEILDRYWDFWSEQVIKVRGPDFPHLNKETCIEDWVVSNWAWEKK